MTIYLASTHAVVHARDAVPASGTHFVLPSSLRGNTERPVTTERCERDHLKQLLQEKLT